LRKFQETLPESLAQVRFAPEARHMLNDGLDPSVPLWP
jgi:hypothetical protein